MTEPLPKIYANQYVLLSRVGMGGMAEIFAAVPLNQPTLSSLVAIKRMLPRFSDNSRFVDMLTAEAKIGTLLNHPNIVAVEDLGTGEGTFFMVMELVLGKSLDLVQAKLKGAKRGLPVGVSLAILSSIAQALDFAHQAKDPQGRPLMLVHRDVTPGNVLLGYDGRVKLTDFGIATAADAHPSDERMALGKLAYMSAEQIRRQPVTPASDIYALAVLAYELLSGERPYQAENEVQLQELILRQAPTPLSKHLPKLPPPVETIFANALAKEVGERPKSCTAFVESLIRFFPAATAKEVATKLQELFKAERRQEITNLESGLAQIEALKMAEQQSSAENRRAELTDQAEAERTVFAAKEQEKTTFKVKENIKASTPPKRQSPKPPPEEEQHAATADELMHSLLNQPYVEASESEEKGPTKVTPKVAFGKATLGRIKLESRQQARDEFFDSLDENTAPGEKAPADLEVANEKPAGDTPSPGEAAEPSSNEAPVDLAEDLALVSTGPSYDPDAPVVPVKRAPSAIPGFGAPALEPLPDLELDIRPEPVKPKERLAARSLNGVKPEAQRESAPSRGLGFFGIVLILVSALVSAAGFYWYAKQPKVDRNKLAKASSAVLAPKLEIFLLSEKLGSTKEERTLARFLAPAKVAGPSLNSLTDFFHQERKRLAPDSPPLSLSSKMHGPFMVSLPSPDQGAWYDRYRFYNYFYSELKKLSIEPAKLGPNDFRLFIYFYRLEDHGPNRYPLEYFGQRRAKEGIVYLPVDRDAFEFSLVMVAHEILHLLGAQDKVDDYGKPFFPEGYAEPSRQPLYPQKYAEIMARSLPFSAEKTLPITHLKQVRIGLTTAKEIGWLATTAQE